ncbi:MAG: SDR family NAD(P)-dependent oxidoreductase [Acidimicrobiales bacterium]
MPLGSSSTSEDVMANIDLTDTVAVVTGGYRGLGRETARALAASGAAVTIAGRDAERLASAAAELSSAGPVEVEVLQLDLSDQSSVEAAAASFAGRHNRLDLLINNAGIMGCDFELSVDGHELQLATNHLGHFTLTNRLTPLLVAAAPSRVVNLSSAGHRASDIVWDDPHFSERPYDKWAAYGQAKTANVLHVVGLQARLGPRGVDAFAVMPGMIFTALGRHLTEADIAELTTKTAASSDGPGITSKSVAAGAATTLWCATAPSLTGHGGVYCEDCAVAEPSDRAGAGLGYEPYAVDPAAAERLWELSESMLASRADR